MQREISEREYRQAVTSGAHQLVFIDDGGPGAHQLPPEILVPNFLAYVAVIVLPDALDGLHEGYREWMSGARVDAPTVTELHATEIINPKRRDAWHDVPMVVRAKHLRRAVDLLLRHVDTCLYGGIGAAQFHELINEARANYPTSREALEGDFARHDHGLERTFHKALAFYLWRRGTSTMLVQDNGRHTQKFKHQFAPELPIWKHGVAYLNSEDVPGIQVADLVSGVMNREYFIRDRVTRGLALSPVDRACQEVLQSLAGRLHDVWSVGGAAAEALDASPD